MMPKKVLAQAAAHEDGIADWPDANAVVSSTTNASGQTVVVSRFRDDIWELWPCFKQSNLTPSQKRLDWRTVEAGFRTEFKTVAFRYWTEGNPGFARPIARSLVQIATRLRGFGNFLSSIGIQNVQEIRPLHLANYVHHRKSVDRVTTGTLAQNLIAIEMLYRFRSVQGLQFQPWPKSSAVAEAGLRRSIQRRGVTPLIPEEILKSLFVTAEDYLAQADNLLDQRDSGRRKMGFDPELHLLRDACFFLLGLLTGMRCEEIIGIDAGAVRSESRGDVTFNWIRSVEHKTKKGAVEYLMPALGVRVVNIMERWSAPLRLALQHEAASAATSASCLDRHAEAITDMNRIFLGLGGAARDIRAISGAAMITRMQRFAARAKVQWPLRPHQLRRAYAWAFARHRLGNLLFLKEQFKHTSLSMTQLYASNLMQDEGLYEEIFEEISQQKIELVDDWLSSNKPLAGRAGERIVKLRAHDFPDRSAMLRETASMVNIRSTGHAWCLAQEEGCGGAGLYEPTRCGGCVESVIDSSQRKVWVELRAHQLSLVNEARNLGPATMQRVNRDLRITEQVLRKLGWDGTDAASAS